MPKGEGQLGKKRGPYGVNRKTDAILVRLTPAQLERWQAAAHCAQLSTPELVRRAVEAWISAPKPAPSPR